MAVDEIFEIQLNNLLVQLRETKIEKYFATEFIGPA